MTSALETHGYVYVSKAGLHVLLNTLLELQQLFFRRATPNDKQAATLYTEGIARGYVPAKNETAAAVLSDRVERLLFAFQGNAVPKAWKLLGATTQELIDTYIAPIAQCVLHSMACNLAGKFPQYGDGYKRFFGFTEETQQFTPTLQANTLYYPPIDWLEQAAWQDHASLVVEPPHVDLSALTLIPRASSRNTRLFDPVRQEWQESYGEGIPEDSLLVFNGKTQENLTYAFLGDAHEGTSGSLYPALIHSAEMDKERSDEGRVVTACFVNGAPDGLLQSIKTNHAFHTVSDRRPEALREIDPLPAPRTVASRVILE